MTRKRNDNHSTEFGLWLREEKELDSALGFTATNIDYLWRNYKNKLWMLLEEKRYESKLTFTQKICFSGIERSIHSPYFRGFHLIVFQNTSPEDGLIFVDEESLAVKEFIDFLKFDLNKEFYESYFKKINKRKSLARY